MKICLPAELSSSVTLKAIGLEHLHVSEVAWLRPDVMEILRELEGTEVTILGGDVLKKCGDRFEHEYSNWSVTRRADETAGAYAERSRKETAEYVRAFPDPGDGSIAYVLVFAQ